MSLRTLYRRVREVACWRRPRLVAKGDPDRDQVLAALRRRRLASGRWIYQAYRKAISATLVAFLDQLLAAYPAAPVVAVICDNVVIHRSKLVNRWLEAHPRMRVLHGVATARTTTPLSGSGVRSRHGWPTRQHARSKGASARSMPSSRPAARHRSWPRPRRTVHRGCQTVTRRTFRKPLRAGQTRPGGSHGPGVRPPRTRPGPWRASSPTAAATASSATASSISGAVAVPQLGRK